MILEEKKVFWGILLKITSICNLKKVLNTAKKGTVGNDRIQHENDTKSLKKTPESFSTFPQKNIYILISNDTELSHCKFEKRHQNILDFVSPRKFSHFPQKYMYTVYMHFDIYEAE